MLVALVIQPLPFSSFLSIPRYCYVPSKIDFQCRLIEASLQGYYRRATALLELHQYRKALDDFKMVLSLKPGDKDAQRQLRKCEQIIRAKGFELPDSSVSGACINM